MLLFSLFVAGSFVFGKLYAELIEPEILTFYRFLLGATLLGLYLIVTKRLSRDLLFKPWRYLILGGIYSIYFVFMFIALRYTSTISTSAIFALMPFATLILESMIFNPESRIIFLASSILESRKIWSGAGLLMGTLTNNLPLKVREFFKFFNA